MARWAWIPLPAPSSASPSSPISAPTIRSSLLPSPSKYGPVDIGGKTYICPVRSEALAVRYHWDLRNAAIPAAAGAIPSFSINLGPTRECLEPICFTHYHIYRGESRILTDA